MIKHILKLCWKQGRINAWILAELLLSFVFLWFTIDSYLVDTFTYLRPLGYNIEHVYKLDPQVFNEFAARFVPNDKINSTLGEDFEKLRQQVEAHPAVEACCFSLYAYPYAQGYLTYDLEKDSLNQGQGKYLQRLVSPSFFQVFRIKDPSGKLISPTNFNGNSIVISSDTEHDFFPEGTGMGKELILKESTPCRIVGVCQPIRRNEFEISKPTYFLPFDPTISTEHTQYFPLLPMEMCIRLHEQYDKKEFAENFVKDMGERLIVNNLYISNIQSVATLRGEELEMSWNERMTQVFLVGFLLLNVFFGIIGTFWLRTQQRIPEIGLRKAMGATRVSLRQFVIAEGLCLLTAAALLSIPIFINLLLADKVETARLAFGLLRFIAGFAFTYLVLAIMILMGVWYPTWKANKVQAAEALHNE